MLSMKSWPPSLILLPSLFLIFSTFLPLSNGSSQVHHLLSFPTENFQGRNNEEHDLLRGIERLVLEDGKNTVLENTTLILAANNTHRRNPLNRFHYYTGGWDYKNVHYWASVSFSGAPLFVIAILWFLVLGISILFYCLCCCCCRGGDNHGYPQTSSFLLLVLLIIFTITAFTGSVMLYTNQQKFHESVEDTLGYIVNRAISVFEDFMNVLRSLVAAKTATLNDIALPPPLLAQIDTVDKMVETTANIPEVQSIRNSIAIRRVLDPTRMTLNILASVLVTVAFLGFLFAVFGLEFLVIMWVILGWVLITMTLVLCGVFLIFHNVVADTCLAMGDWLQRPTANSVLNLQFLPCMDNATAQQTLNISKQTTSYLVDVVNKYIESVANNDNTPPKPKFLFYNQSGPFVPFLCDPYNPDMTNRNCASTEIKYSNVEQEWQKFVCEPTGDNICSTQGRLTPDMYKKLTSYANVSYSLYRTEPFLSELGECRFVLETFNDISTDFCPNLARYSFLTFLGLVIVSASVMCSLILWIIYSREKRRRKYAQKLIARNRNNTHNPFAGRET